jgi:glycosyltransferase involved in cell wall biosynthesis
MKVFVTTGWYLPGIRAGGEVVSVARILAAESAHHDIRLATSDRDLDASAPYPSAIPRDWVRVGPISVAYVDHNSLAQLAWLLREVRRWRPELVYLNSLWHAQATLLPLLARRVGLLGKVPFLVAPRGSCSPGALAMKARKKRLFTPLVRWLLSGESIWWHASSDREKADIQAWMRRELDPTHVIVDLDPPVAPMAWQPVPEPAGPGAPLRLAFVSRIVWKKGLDRAIEILHGVSEPVILDVYGPLEDEKYWAKCEEMAAGLPPHVKVRYCGLLEPEDVAGVFRQAHAFLFPTRGENFGHVIAESLAVGCPVICGEDTIWGELLERGAGHVVSNNAAASSYIDALATASVDEVTSTRGRVVGLYSEWFGSCEFGELFEQARAAGAVPEGVASA